MATSQAEWMSVFAESLEPSAAAKRSQARLAARARTVRYYGKEATARIPQVEPEAEYALPLPELKIVAHRRPRLGVVMLIVAALVLLLATGVVCPVLIGTATTGVESAMGRLESKQEELSALASELAAQVAALSAPDRIAEQAAEMGLVPATTVQYLDAAQDVAGTEGDTTAPGR